MLTRMRITITEPLVEHARFRARSVGVLSRAQCEVEKYRSTSVYYSLRNECCGGDVMISRLRETCII